MKKVFKTAGLVIACAITFYSNNACASFAKPDDKPGVKLVAALQKDYPQAALVKWSHNGKEFIATFNSKVGRVTATYDKKGKLLSTLISSNGQNMPFNILTALNKNYPGFEAQDMTEYIKQTEHNYYILLKNTTDNHVDWLRVKSDEMGHIQVLQKLQQDI